MAAWQADFHFIVAALDLPADYRARFGRVLPVGRSWSDVIETWGTGESDRIDVSREPGTPPEVFCRFDLRVWKPDLYSKFIACLSDIGGRLETATGKAVPLESAAFERALRGSSAAEFVADPHRFLEQVVRNRSRS